MLVRTALGRAMREIYHAVERDSGGTIYYITQLHKSRVKWQTAIKRDVRNTISVQL